MTIERPMFPPVDPSRRGFLAQAAVVAAGGAALGVALPLPGSVGASERVPDPILDVIERHRTALADWLAALDQHTQLEEELPSDRRQSCITIWDEDIVESDDPRWIESEWRADRTWNETDQVGWELVKVQPTTIAGLAALMAYVTMTEDNDDDQVVWPQLSPDGEDAAETWSCVLHRNLAMALKAMAAGVQS